MRIASFLTVCLLLSLKVHGFDCEYNKTNIVIVDSGQIDLEKYSNILIECVSNDSSNADICRLIKNVTIARFASDTFANKSIYYNRPAEIDTNTLIIRIGVIGKNESNVGAKVASSFMFGLMGAAISSSVGGGKIAVGVELIEGNREKSFASAAMTSITSGGLSWAAIPYQSIICISRTVYEYVNSEMKGN